jgi:hypothetical protein
MLTDVEAERAFEDLTDLPFVEARTDELVGGFSIATRITDIPARIRQTDPVVGAWREHLQANPVGPGEIVLVLRRWLDRD